MSPPELAREDERAVRFTSSTRSQISSGWSPPAPLDRAGVVDEDVDLSGRAHRRDQLVDLGAIREVAAVGGEAAPNASTAAATSLPSSSEALTPTMSAPAAARATARCPADPASASRDERRPAREVEGRGVHARQSTRIFIAGPSCEELIEHRRHTLERLDRGDQPLEIERARGEQLDRGARSPPARTRGHRASRAPSRRCRTGEPASARERSPRRRSGRAGRRTSVTASMPAADPETSNTTSAPTPPLSSRTRAATSSEPGSTASSPSSPASSPARGVGLDDEHARATGAARRARSGARSGRRR